MNDNVQMAASHPGYPALPGEELTRKSAEVPRLIELCGASVELTNAASAASDLVFHVRRFVAEASIVSTDRGIKAANLQLLVEKVLMWEVQDSAFQIAPELQSEFSELMNLARSLKQ